MVDIYWQVDRNSDQAKKWFRRCAWRDYAYWMLHHWTDLPEAGMRPAFDKLEWLVDGQDDSVTAWKNGATGYPLVDAAMRELKQTGYLQQNVRHTVGQFLIEVMGADWRDGEEWFHIALADSDLAINSMMWQHQGLAGVSQWLIGIDCHPVKHARAVDPSGSYVRKWVPELAQLPDRVLHCPWDAPAATLRKANVELGPTYPHRIVEDVEGARAAFLQRAIQCRNAAPRSCFSNDGCDLLTLPSTSRLSMNGIRALTEKFFAMQTIQARAKESALHSMMMTDPRRRRARAKANTSPRDTRNPHLDNQGQTLDGRDLKEAFNIVAKITMATIRATANRATAGRSDASTWTIQVWEHSNCLVGVWTPLRSRSSHVAVLSYCQFHLLMH